MRNQQSVLMALIDAIIQQMRLLREATRNGNLDLIRELVKRLRNLRQTFDFLDVVDTDGLTALHVAIMNARVECLKELLKIGCSPEVSCNGTPVLHLAFLYASLPHLQQRMLLIIEELCKVGASLTAKDLEGRTVLHIMARTCFSSCPLESCQALDKAKEKICLAGNGIHPYRSTADYLFSQKDIVDENPFHVAAKYGNITVLKSFLNYCSSYLVSSLISSVNEDGNTPLHLAAIHNHPNILTSLISVCPGCLLIRNKTGKRVLDLAEEHGHQKILRLFTGRNGKDLQVDEDKIPTQVLPTWILTSKSFKRHKTYSDRFDIRIVPPENSRRWSVLADPNHGILHTEEFRNLKWKEDLTETKVADILKVHSFSYYLKIKKKCMDLAADNSEVFHLDGDTTISHDTFRCALLAAGSVCQAIDLIMRNQAKNAFCVVRPPGHHAGYRGFVPSASPSGSNGFCIFNNVAIGAAYALDVYRHQGIKKVALLDFDVHHGNGTEECVLNTAEHPDYLINKVGDGDEIIHVKTHCSPWIGDDDAQNIFFASVQGYGNQGGDDIENMFYPGSGETKDIGFNGKQDSYLSTKGISHYPSGQFLEAKTAPPRIITIGLSGPGSVVESWKESWSTKILPEVVDFNPDLILVSAGFDAHQRDDINGGFVGLETHHYEWITQILVEVANKCCQGRLVSVLEGGYSIQGGLCSAFANSVASHVRALNTTSKKKWNAKEQQLETQLTQTRVEIETQRNLSRKQEECHQSSDPEDDGYCNLDELSIQELATDNGNTTKIEHQSPSKAKRRRVNVDYVALNKVLDEEEKQMEMSQNF